MLDGLLGGLLGGGKGGGLMDLVLKNPQLAAAVASLLSSRDTAVGGSGGLSGLVGMFQRKGLGNLVSGWISTGPNPGISASQLTDVLGGDTISQFARKAGVPDSEAGSLLAGILPTVIDKLTPDGKLPDTDSLENTLGGFLSKLG
jgi:uncharacterized protein YidB (DUF937 family)